MKFHSHLVIDPVQSMGLNELKEKTTVIMATSQSDMMILMWSVFSLFLRSSSFEHLMVSINGPNKKTGNPNLQNIKQKFFEKLIEEYDLPISLLRIIGRQGHAHSIDSCIPWVHTEYYTLMHDDVLLLRDWNEELSSSGYLADPRRSVILCPPNLVSPMQVSKFKEQAKLGIPHLNTFFVHVKKSVTESFGSRWHGYHSPFEFTLDGDWADEFLDFHNEHISKSVKKGQKFYFHSTDVGTYIWYELIKNNHRIYNFSKDFCIHIRESSWCNNLNLAVRLDRYKNQINELNKQILDSRFCDIYKEFSVHTNINFE
jgi:hypothetical protein